jgi:hypothetical protein
MATGRETESQRLQGRCWRLASVSDHSAFFRNAPEILPADAVLVLEGGRQPQDLRAFVKKHEVPPGAKIAAGTVWPRPAVHHIPATATVLRELADLTEHCAAPEVCDHLHAYKGSGVLLQWYDAFSEPLYLSKLISQDRVERFCAALEIAFTDEECGGEGELKG